MGDEELDDFIVDDDGAGYALDFDQPKEFKKYFEKGKNDARKVLHDHDDFSMLRGHAIFEQNQIIFFLLST